MHDLQADDATGLRITRKHPAIGVVPGGVLRLPRTACALHWRHITLHLQLLVSIKD